MKILKITYSLSPGGAERFLVDLSNELSKFHEVHLLSILDDKIDNNGFYLYDIDQDVFYHNLKMKRGFSFSKIFRLFYFIYKCKPDIIHFHGVNIILLFIFPILFYRKPKYVETLHNSADKIFTFKRFSFITKQVYKLGLVKLCTISYENKRSLEHTCKIFNSSLIFNARSLPKLVFINNEVLNEINALKRFPDDIVFVHIGRCSPEKNQLVLVQSFNELNRIGHNFVLIIIGDGFNSDLGLKLKSISCDRIHFLGTKKNVIDYLNVSNAFCLSSFYEGMPISLIESIYVGCFPICTPVSGVIDVIEDGITGFISKDFTSKSYINLLLKFFSIRNQLDKRKLIQVYDKYFSIEECSKKYIQVYDNLLKI